MPRSTAALGSVAFFVIGPGIIAGLIPWLIARWEFLQPLPFWVIAQIIGGLLVGMGLVLLLSPFVEFIKAGGTPAPIAPTQRLVVSGFNRYTRNPMYFGLVLATIGQALLFGSLRLLIYAAALWIVSAAFVRWYEEPALMRQFGAEYKAYQGVVPAWWLRLRPWTPNAQHDVPQAR